MKLYAYRGSEPNFGDELNHWLMPRIFPDLFDEDESTLFLGIGSALFDTHSSAARKIVFGTGFGGYTNVPVLDEQWTIYCVRGAMTARALGLDERFVAGDAAILINRYRAARSAKATKISFMPHFQSIRRGHWERTCRLAGIAFIDPRQDVECVLRQIEDSKLVITEAMHGAIVADALRVPWIAVLPFDRSHRMKWQDWASALEMSVRFRRLFPSSGDEAMLLLPARFNPRFRLVRLLRRALMALDACFVVVAAIGLRVTARRHPAMSSDLALERAVSRLQAAAEQIRRLHPGGAFRASAKPSASP